ncbi:hypothetical protein ACIGB8_28755 [Promicromonospora sukumoe]|uniref:hypothetical protein n=1 Tax=Promicromonospora sukumoe TaxID=88382 RepID=UPI0037CB5BFD
MGTTPTPRHARAIRPALHVVTTGPAERLHPAVARGAIIRHWAEATIAWADVLGALSGLRGLTAPTARPTGAAALSVEELTYLRDAARLLQAYVTRCGDELDRALDVHERIDPNHRGLAAGLPESDGPDGPRIG